VRVVLAEVATAGAEGREQVAHLLEGAVVVPLVGDLSVSSRHGGGSQVPGWAPDEELALDEVLVDAEVTPGGRGDLGAVVKAAVSVALGVLDVLLLRVDHVTDLAVHVHLGDEFPWRWAHALVSIITRSSVCLGVPGGLVEAGGGGVEEVGEVDELSVVVQSQQVLLDVLPWVGLVLVADPSVVKELVLGHGLVVAEGVCPSHQSQR